MEKTIFAPNGITLKIPKDADKIRVLAVQKLERIAVEVTWISGI